MSLIYLLLRCTAWLGIAVFYPRRLLLGREHLRFDGPAIVVVNHPNTLMDVLVPGIHIRQVMFFLANYSLFKNPVSGWLLRRLFCIPVKRREDVAEGESRDNEAAFEQSFEHLEKKGVLFIAPEGVSWMHRFVRPLKTGTARIAFGAEARRDWQLDVKIIPIGLTYSAPDRFRSASVVHVGAPVFPRDWIETWSEDPEAAVDDLTLSLENQLKHLTVHCRDEAGEQFVARLETILQNEKPLPLRGAFLRSQRLANTRLDDAGLREKTAAYFENLAKTRLNDAGLRAADRPSGGQTFRDAIFLTAGLPVFLTGYAFWFLPCFLPWLLAKRMKVYVGYEATVKMLAGLFTFPLALWGAFHLARSWGQTGWSPWVSVVAYVLFGLFAERWLAVFGRAKARWRAGRYAKRAPAEWKNLLAQRAEIVQVAQPDLH